MNLKSFGCSFIFGSELSDDGRTGLYATGSKLTWPAHIAQHRGLQYRTYARPGSGNLQIAEKALAHLATNEHAFFVIGWTYIDRFDYIDASIADKWLGRPWATLMPIDTTDIAHTYYKNLHSEIRDKLTTLINVRVVIDTLKQKGCPFIMTYMDDLMFDKQYNTTPAITDLQDYIKPYMTTFEDMNFQQWSKKNGYAITSIGHPLEAAHAAAGKLMIKVFDTQNTIDR